MRPVPSARKLLVGALAAAAVTLAPALSSPALAADAPAPERVELSAWIIVDAPQQEVYDVLGDLRNDPEWRGGVSVDAPSPQQVGDAVTEKQTFAGGFTVATPETVTVKVAPCETALRSTADAPYYTEHVRLVRPYGDERTTVTEYFRVDETLLADAYPGLPGNEAVAAYEERLETDLQHAKSLIENG